VFQYIQDGNYHFEGSLTVQPHDLTSFLLNPLFLLLGTSFKKPGKEKSTQQAKPSRHQSSSSSGLVGSLAIPLSFKESPQMVQLGNKDPVESSSTISFREIPLDRRSISTSSSELSLRHSYTLPPEGKKMMKIVRTNKGQQTTHKRRQKSSRISTNWRKARINSFRITEWFVSMFCYEKY